MLAISKTTKRRAIIKSTTKELVVIEFAPGKTKNYSIESFKRNYWTL